MTELALVSGVGAEKHLPRFDAATYDSYIDHFNYADEVWEHQNTPRVVAAWKLLRDFLTPTQALSLTCRKAISVKGSLGGHYYLDDNGQHLYQLDRTRKTTYSVCFHEADPDIFPLDDIILTKILWITSDEAKFRWHSNIQEMRYGRDWYHQFLRETTYMHLIVALSHVLASYIPVGGTEAEAAEWLNDFDGSRFRQEYDNMVDIYRDHPRLLWRLIDRFKDQLQEEDKYLIDHIPVNLARTEEYYAR